MDVSDSYSSWSLSTALSAAVAGSACCTIPLVLVSLGIGGSWISALLVLEPYRWAFAVLSVGALGYAGYQEWNVSRPDCECESALSPVVRRSILGLGGGLVLALLATPWMLTLPSSTSAGPAGEPSPGRTVVLEVDGMTCAACSTTVRKALNQVQGVHRTEVTFTPPRAVVHFDPSKTSVDRLTQATENAGHPSRAIPSPHSRSPQPSGGGA